jgi:DNA-binding CsgD family transcriptional regulator
MLAACADIMLSAGDFDAARSAADELLQIAGTVDLPLVRAMAAFAAGAVLVADDQAVSALAPLRNACAEWRRLEMPYDTARARVHIALACRALGDHDSARFEFEAARATFEHLGARPDLERASRLFGDGDRGGLPELTDRECEVMRLLATGKSNREMAALLTISEHTVARHVQNIFMKLHLSTRAAATAYAYDHHLV